MPNKIIEIEIEAENVLEINAKIEALEVIKKLDADALSKLAIIGKDPVKAASTLRSKWLFIKPFF